jgi:hypothetical protein
MQYASFRRPESPQRILLYQIGLVSVDAGEATLTLAAGPEVTLSLKALQLFVMNEPPCISTTRWVLWPTRTTIHPNA